MGVLQIVISYMQCKKKKSNSFGSQVTDSCVLNVIFVSLNIPPHHDRRNESNSGWVARQGVSEPGTCPGLPHLSHWMWRGKHSCDENKFIITGSVGLQNDTTSGQPVRIEHEIAIRKLNYPSVESGKRQMGENSTLLIETPFLDNFGLWVINKGTYVKSCTTILSGPEHAVKCVL